MEIKSIKVEAIKPDKNQPRQSHPEPGAIDELAQSIKEHGLINPIEVDDGLVMVTGHLRLEAAKRAGLKPLPARIVNFDNDKVRFAHQLTENLQQNSMSDMDIARALGKLVSSAPGADKKGSGGHNDKGISRAAKAIGKSEAYVREKLKLLDLPERLMSGIEEKRVPASYARVLDGIPEQFKEGIIEKLLAGEFQSRESAMAVRAALQNRPDQEMEIFNIDFTGMNETVVNENIAKIIPDYSPIPISESVDRELDVGNSITAASKKLVLMLESHKYDEVATIQQITVVLALRSTVRTTAVWLGQPMPDFARAEQQQLTIRTTGKVKDYHGH